MYRVVMIALCLALLTGCGVMTFNLQPDVFTRQSTIVENIYVDLAALTRSPTPCERISRRAYTNRISFLKMEVSYTRSECYMVLAAVEKDSRYCEYVKTYPSISIDTDHVGGEICRKQSLTSRHKLDDPRIRALLNISSRPATLSKLLNRKQMNDEDIWQFYQSTAASERGSNTPEIESILQNLPDCSEVDCSTFNVPIEFLH